jgi:hypothetical protein
LINARHSAVEIDAAVEAVVGMSKHIRTESGVRYERQVAFGR